MVLGITISPASQSIVFGESISFTSVVTGALNASNVTYQWKKGGVALTGEGNQSASYVYTPSGVGIDSITCYIEEDGNGNATSSAKVVTVLSVYNVLASAEGYLRKIAAAI